MSPDKTNMPFPIELAAMENLTPFYFVILGQLGLEVVVVRFQAAGDSPIWEHAEIERELEKELQSIQAGYFDSRMDLPGAMYLFFHASALGKAMQQLRSSLAARGLLEITQLLHAESAQELRVWHPATAELLNVGDESES